MFFKKLLEGEKGEPGIPGEKGEKGDPGEKGEKGDPGDAPAVHVVSAFSVKTRTSEKGAPLLLDKNSVAVGSAVTHTEQSGIFTIHETGVYMAAFGATAAAAGKTEKPVHAAVKLMAGSSETGGGSSALLMKPEETAYLGITQPLTIGKVPETIRVLGGSQPFSYKNAAFTIYKMGELPKK